MNKKLQVFVSSTYTDLIEERQAAVQAILDAGHIPAGMELFKAGNESQLKTIYKWIDESDVYMLILGGRYGSIEKKSGKSYTQLEYEYALSKNIPVFAVVLSESFLIQKITSLGLENATEQIAPDKYKEFKTLVMSKIIKKVDDCKDIKLAVHSSLYQFLNEYNLIGWVKADNAILNTDAKNYSDSQLQAINDNVFNQLIMRNYPIYPQDFLDKFTKIQNELLKYEGLINSYKRETNLYLIDQNQLRVETTTIYNYEYLLDKHYQKSFFATEQQSDSFKMEKLQINDIDYTEQFEKVVEYKKIRGQFPCKVKSKNSFPIDTLPATILEISSYTCPPLDFIQKAEPPFPCKNFNVTVKLHNDIENQYSIIGIVFSQFSTDHADDYKSNQMRNTETYYTMQLPEWSLPGSGYMVALKNK